MFVSFAFAFIQCSFGVVSFNWFLPFVWPGWPPSVACSPVGLFTSTSFLTANKSNTNHYIYASPCCSQFQRSNRIPFKICARNVNYLVYCYITKNKCATRRLGQQNMSIIIIVVCHRKICAAIASHATSDQSTFCPTMKSVLLLHPLHSLCYTQYTRPRRAHNERPFRRIRLASNYGNKSNWNFAEIENVHDWLELGCGKCFLWRAICIQLAIAQFQSATTRSRINC